MSLSNVLPVRLKRIRARAAEGNFGKDHSLNYVLAFSALGMFVAVMALALGLDAAAF